jgi:hypothetical protein
MLDMRDLGNVLGHLHGQEIEHEPTTHLRRAGRGMRPLWRHPRGLREPSRTPLGRA